MFCPESRVKIVTYMWGQWNFLHDFRPYFILFYKGPITWSWAFFSTQVTTLRNDRGAKTFAHNVEYIYVPLSFFHSCHAVACVCWWCRRLWKSSAILSALHGGCCGIHSRWRIDHPESNGFCGSPRHLSGADVRSPQSPFTRSKLSSESTVYREMFKSTIPKAQHLSGKRNVSWWKSPQLPLLFLLNCTCEERTVRPQWHCATGLHELKDQPCGLCFFCSLNGVEL